MDVAAGDAQAAAPEVAPEATPVEVPVDAPATSPEPGKHHHDVTVSRSFVAPCRAEPRPTYLFGPLVVVVKCDLPTYPDGATGDNGTPLRQGAGTLRYLVCRFN